MNTLVEQQTSPINFSESAYKEIVRLDSSKTPNSILRIGAKGGGCSGLTYVLDYGASQEGDLIFHYREITFAIQPAHLLYLKNMTIEYNSGLNARGFTFQNPNASNTCGCGTSFAV